MSDGSSRWLSLAYKWLMPIALAAAIGVAAITVISAASHHGERGHDRSQSWSEDEFDDGEECARIGKRGLGGDVAALVGTDAEGLKAALSEGKTLAQIAVENGVEVQSVIDSLVERANERIDAAVEAGKLTEEEAETKKSQAAEKIEDVVNNGFGDGHWGKSRWRGHGRGLWGSTDDS